MSTAFKRADILLPKSADMSKWAVVACDQYTSEPEYWEKTAQIVGDAPSTLNLILPEVYLEKFDVEDRIHNIHTCMENYIDNGVFEEYKNTMLYFERVQDDGRVRQGLVGAIDLEEYDYSKGSVSSVRATEATVVERIPPRVKVRRNAPIELPHIMILIDDEDETVVEAVGAKKDTLKKVYDFDLMQKGGKATGYIMTDEMCDYVEKALETLGSRESFDKKYNLADKPVLLYAMGDGNHSLATAKAYYEELKAQYEGVDLSCHPARYALVEIVNLHSEALEFEAIHRIVTEVDTKALLKSLYSELELSDEVSDQKITIIEKGEETVKYIHNPLSKLAVGSLQTVLDKKVLDLKGKIDYIHGIDVVKNLSMKENSIGFVLEDMAKSDLFPTVICDGALPRKTFSMGHAWDKRYYIECRKIK